MGTEMQEFFTWTILGTYAGATLATSMITQVLKGIIPMKTQVLSIIIAFLVLIAATAFTTGLTLDKSALCAINAVVVGFASNGAYEAAKTTASKD